MCPCGVKFGYQDAFYDWWFLWKVVSNGITRYVRKFSINVRHVSSNSILV